MYNVGDEEDVEKLQEKTEAVEDTEELELQNILQTYGGRRWFWKILSQCGVFNTAFSEDTNFMAFKTGRQDIGLWVLSKIMEADEEAFIKMQREANDRAKDDS